MTGIIAAASLVHQATPNPSAANDQAAAKSARTLSTNAAAKLVADQRSKASASIIQADQKAVQTDKAAVTRADAKVTSDANAARVNVTA